MRNTDQKSACLHGARMTVGAQTFREALRALVFRWSASEPTAELIAELQAEIEVLRTTQDDERRRGHP